MKYKSVFVIFLALGLGFSCFAQDKTQIDNSKTKRVSDIYSYKQSTSNYLLLNQVESNISDYRSNTVNNVRNVTIIQQVGSQNQAVANNNSDISNINYLQVGDSNIIESTSFIENTAERLIQTGNNNSINSFSFGNVDASSLQILQNGNNQIFEKFGTNNLTDNLTLRVSGNNQTVIIRSF